MILSSLFVKINLQTNILYKEMFIMSFIMQFLPGIITTVFLSFVSIILANLIPNHLISGGVFALIIGMFINPFISKYKNQLDLQKKTYDKLKLKDKEIISINDNILSNSKNIINFYSSTANELNQIRQKKFIIQYNKDLEKQSKVVRNLLLGLFISSLLLLAYSFVASNYENKLQQAKISPRET